MFKELRSFFIISSLMLITGGLFTSCDQRSSEGMIIMTQVDKDQEIKDFNSTDFPRVLSGAQIMMMDPANPQRQPLLLSKDFYSAFSPAISFNAKKMVFSGQKNQHDTWQIYEMDLASLQYKPLTNSKENCTDPVYLPGDKIIYSQVVYSDNGQKGQALFARASGGNQEEQITFNPGSYAGTSMLHDGRIISMNRSLTSELNKSNLMVMRPDGTKEMLFYKSEDQGQLISKGMETETGEIYLLEKNDEGLGKLFSISYNNPLKSRKLISEKVGGDFIGISPMVNGRLLVCYRKSKEASYGLFELDPRNMKLVRSVFNDPRYKTIEALVVEQHMVPKKIPSEVNMKEQTALLLCQDVNFLGFHQDTAMTKGAKAVKIEVLGLTSSLGTVDVEKDGSVYLKLKADTPFQLQTLNEEGEIVNGPSSWINLRPNERRACVGCHQGNEVVPANRQPLSVLKEPIQIPREPRLLAGKE
jgi:hypothetical protein